MRDTRLRIYGQLTINIVSLLCFYLSSIIDNGISVWKLLLYTTVTTFIVWELLRLSIIFARKRFPEIVRTRQRLVMVTFFTLLIVVIVPFVKFGFSIMIHLYGNKLKASDIIRVYNYLGIMGQNIFYCLFIAAVYEAIYFFELWKEMFKKAEALKKEQLLTQFNSLKEQMSPHFLFNSLNTLSSLVRRDATKAEQYVDEMAAVYHYLLGMKDKDLVPLEEELKFIESYTHLLQTRFNDHFKVFVNVSPVCRTYMLPPLTLQLLVENAVKHNVVDSTSPLELTIKSDHDEKLIIQNRIQKRRRPMPSEKKGLNNIVARYELLNLPEVVIEETSDHFTVILPLTQNSIHESVSY